MFKSIKKYRIYVINIFLAISIFLFYCAITKTYPFGPRVLGVSDGIAQFKPMIFDIFSKIKMGTMGTYSFNNGLGNPFIFNILYYVSSPLNVICLLLKSSNSMYFWLLLIKIALTSLHTTIYAKSKTSKNTIIIIATISYCYCGWFLTYYYYNSFVDIFMMFPLFQYGLEKMFNKKKVGVYIYSLTYMIISNFYLSFSVCVYTLLYFVINELIYKKNNIKEKINNFKTISFATVIVFLLCFFWIYMLYDSYKRMGLSFGGSIKNDYYVTIKGLVSSLFYGQEELTIARFGEIIPNVGCNYIILISLFYFFLNHKIKARERIYSLIVLLLIVNFMVIPRLDFVLNFFHEIRALPFRYSFIACFLEIVLFLKNAENTDLKDKKCIREIIISILLVVTLSIYARDYFYDITFLLEIVSILSFLVIICFYQNNRVIHSLLISIIIIVTITNHTFTKLTNDGEKIPVIKDSYIKKDVTYREYISNSYCNRNGVKNLILTSNCNLLFNGKTIDLLTSMTYSNVIYDLKKIGEYTYDNTTIDFHEKNNIPLNMLFNIKNRFYLEKIYSVDKNILNVKLQYKDYVNNQNNIIKAMTGVDNIFDKKVIPLLENNNTNNIYFIGESYYYVDGYDLKGNKTNSLSKEPYLVQKINKYNKEIVYYTYNIKNIEKAHDILKKNQIEYSYYTDSKIEGTINLDKDQIIFTSIPYDTNWEIKIDDKIVKPVKIFDSLLGIETKEGKHKIKLEYKEHFTIPILISLITLTVVVYKNIKSKKHIGTI